MQFKKELGTDALEEWRDQIDQTVIPGGIFGETVFFHKVSKTLILADTIINFELNKMRQPRRFATWLTGMYYPQGQIFFGMDLPLLLQLSRPATLQQTILVSVGCSAIWIPTTSRAALTVCAFST